MALGPAGTPSPAS